MNYDPNVQFERGWADFQEQERLREHRRRLVAEQILAGRLTWPRDLTVLVDEFRHYPFAVVHGRPLPAGDDRRPSSAPEVEGASRSTPMLNGTEHAYARGLIVLELYNQFPNANLVDLLVRKMAPFYERKDTIQSLAYLEKLGMVENVKTDFCDQVFSAARLTVKGVDFVEVHGWQGYPGIKLPASFVRPVRSKAERISEILDEFRSIPHGDNDDEASVVRTFNGLTAEEISQRILASFGNCDGR